jgi:hypothetical protein
MNTITVKTAGARVDGRWYDAGTYTSPVHAEFERPGYYWLEPLADHHGERWLEKGIRLGPCNTREQLDSAIDTALRECGTFDDSIWLLGATTEVSIFLEQHHR